MANIASIGMIDLYEQLFVGLGYFTVHGHASSAFWLGHYWGSIGAAAATFGGMLVAFTVLPWSQLRNWPGVALCLGVFGLCMALWFIHGYWGPPNGDSFDYWMNALSRIVSQLALVAAVSSRDFVAVLVGLPRYLGKRYFQRPSVAS